MANTLTNLAGDIYKAADTVGRELVGFIPSVTINAGSERAAKGDTIRSFITASATANNITESMTIPQGDDQTITSSTMTLSSAKAVQIPMTGEDVKHLNNGSGYETVYGDQIAQAMRTLTNAIESDLATAAYQGASRAVGTAGTTPFASNFNTIAQARQIIVDNGGATNDGRLSLVMNTLAGTNLRNLSSLQSVNQAGSDVMLRQGTLLDLQGVMIKESAQVVAHTTVGSDDHVVNGVTAVGDTTITVDGTQTTDCAAGDVVSFSGSSANYVVANQTTSSSLVLNSPGGQAIIADNETIATGASYAANVMFNQNAIELGMRAPAVPNGGDSADDAMLVQDTHSGLVFEIRVYKGYRKQMIEVAATWGTKAWKSDNIALLMG
jgi:hypothetical protein